MLALKRLPEKHTLVKLAAQTNKRTQNKQEGGKDRGGGTNKNMYSASASGDTVVNKSTHIRLMDRLSDRNSVHFIKTRIKKKKMLSANYVAHCQLGMANCHFLRQVV